MNRTPRYEVYHAIDTEREYQDKLPAIRTGKGDKTIGDYVTMLGHYHTKLVAAWIKCPGTDAAMEVVRKIAAIGVRCMEDHGALVRVARVHKPKDPVSFKPDGKWWHADETWSEEHGPFDTEAEARVALKNYCKHLDGESKADAKDLSADGMSEVAESVRESKDPVWFESEGKWFHTDESGDSTWGPFDTEEEASVSFAAYMRYISGDSHAFDDLPKEKPANRGRQCSGAGFKDADKLTWLDVSNEQWREYVYPDGTRYRVDFPLRLNVTKKPGGDSHRVVTENRSVYVAAGWRAIEWQVKPGHEPFTF